MLKPRHRLLHERRVLMQIPIRVGEMGVSQISGQRRQTALGVCARAIALLQDLDGHGVPHIVQTWTRRIRGAAQSDFPGQSAERLAQGRVRNPAAERRYEERPGDASCQKRIALTRIPVTLSSPKIA